MKDYHDSEWGVPVYDDGKIFEFLVLESAQAGLSWMTVLKKRENYRRAFCGFDPEKVAAFQQKKLEDLMNDTGIIRNRMKIEAAVSNARIFIQIAEKHGSFSNYIWSFTGGVPVVNSFSRIEDIPATTDLAVLLSRELKKQGLRFFGPVICYSHMQATGMVNDHLIYCKRHKELSTFHETAQRI